MMGRAKGGTNRSWTAEEKYKAIVPIINGEISGNQRARELGIAQGMIKNWVIAYNKGGFEALINKRKSGNPLTKYARRKELTEIEKLEYEILKLRIENERLKKGYTQKEVDLIKQKKSNKKNLK